MEATVYSELKRISGGGASLSDLAEALARVPEMLFLPPSQRLIEALGGSVPPLHGTLNEAGFIAAVFTHKDFAQHIVDINKLYPGQDITVVQGKSWKQGFYEFLLWGVAGVIIDGGQPHKICINRVELSLVVAQLLKGDFLSGAHYAAMCGAQLQRCQADARTTAIFVYDSEAASQHGLELLRCNIEGAERAQISKLETSALLSALTKSPQTQIVVNFGLPDTRYYSPTDVEEMIRTFGS